MNHTPSGYPSITSAATCSDSRVLPIPPIPSSVSEPRAAKQGPDLRELALRPTNDVTCCGRLLGVVSSERSAGNPAETPDAAS